jgi:hypothetical protein
LEVAHLTIYTAVILFLLIGFAGFVDAIAGGGGLITIPSYIAVGVPANLILGTNKFVNASGTALAVFRMLKHGEINWKLLRLYIVAALVGAFIGALFSVFLDHEGMVYLLLIIVPFMIWINYLKPKKVITQDSQTAELPHKKILIVGLIISFVIGGYDGFFGPGTGTFLFLAFTYFLQFSVRNATVYARVINFTSNVAALGYFLAVNRIDWMVVVIVLPASLIGYWLGSHCVLKGSEKWIKYMVLFVLVLLLIKSILNILGYGW